MAEMALLRASILKGEDITATGYDEPNGRDFANISVLVRNGLFHVVHSPEKIPWERLPPNTIQVRGPKAMDCFMGACRDLDPEEGLSVDID